MHPFVLRVDASDKAIGAVLEQLPGAKGPITTSQALSNKTVPVAFMSKKLTPGQAKKWYVREKEAYAIVMALKKMGLVDRATARIDTLGSQKPRGLGP